MVNARYQPAFVVFALFACAAALTVTAWREGLGIEMDTSWLRALIQVELALPVLLFSAPPPARRSDCLVSLLNLLACFACSSAALLTLIFVSSSGIVLQTRGLSFAAWLAAGGLIALGATLDGRRDHGWRTRLRILWLALTSLPVLWHYFTLEYAQKSLLHLRPLSPHWLLAAFPNADFGTLEFWPLLLIGAAGWVSALTLFRSSPVGPADQTRLAGT